jgi:hypothetical protein
MSRISISKLALVLVLATALTPATGWSAGRRFSTDDSTARIFRTENPLVVFWNYVVGLWDKEGCGLDPSGLCKTNTSSDAGCGLDPSGCVIPSSESAPKNGCGLDPHGANCT